MKRLVASITVATLLTACSGSVPVTSAIPAASSPPGAAQVTFVFVIPGGDRRLARSGAHGRHFVSPSTQSIVVGLDSKPLLVADVAESSHGCERRRHGSRICTIQTEAPSGDQVFTITSFDGTRGNGNVLAAGSVRATLAADIPDKIRVSLTGRPASVALSIAPQNPLAGLPTTVAVAIAALDADGNTIIGSFGTTVTLADNDASGTTKLSPTTISGSSTPVTMSYNGAPLWRALISARAPGVERATTLFAPVPATIAQYNAPLIKINGVPFLVGLWDLCLGPDGNIWATANTEGGIEKITPDGRFTAYPVLKSGPVGISVGTDRNLWFAEANTGKIGKITLDGKITNYSIPTPSGYVSRPSWTTPGADGRTWFPYQAISAAGKPTTSALGAITSTGKITKYPLPRGSLPVQMISGPDGNLWTTDQGLNAILVASTTGKVLAVHHLATAVAYPYGITVGPDKNIWFTELTENQVGRMTTGGALKEFVVPTPFSDVQEITVIGPDGNVWFTEAGGGFWDLVGKVGYVTTDGLVIRDFVSGGNGLGTAHVHDLLFDSEEPSFLY